MEEVTAGAQDELMQSLDYKLTTSNTNYVTARHDVQYFPRARSLWLMSGMCGLSLEPPSRDAAADFCSLKKFRMATHILERREQLRPLLRAAADAEALKRGGGGEPPA